MFLDVNVIQFLILVALLPASISAAPTPHTAHINKSENLILCRPHTMKPTFPQSSERTSAELANYERETINSSLLDVRKAQDQVNATLDATVSFLFSLYQIQYVGT